MLAIIPDYEESSSDEDEGTSVSHGTGPSSVQIGHQEVKRSSDNITLIDNKSQCLCQEDIKHCSNASNIIKTNFNLQEENLIRPSGSFLDDSQETATQGSLMIRTCLSYKKGVKGLPEDEANCSFQTASGSGSGSGGGCKHSSDKLTSEQESVLRYLALKRRRDEEMKQLEMVKDPPELKRRKRNRKKRKGIDEKSCKPVTDHSVNDSTSEMQNLTSYIGVNDHLIGAQVDHGDLAPKSGLEKQIDQAISEGDLSKAEELSDYLAKRNFAVRIAEAAHARDYARHKQEEEKEKLAKKRLKKSKLAWGFEVKHRWEMKGNM